MSSNPGGRHRALRVDAVVVTAGLAMLASGAAGAGEPARSASEMSIDACARPRLAESRRLTAVAIETGLPTSGQWRDGFDVADMNDDGRLDLLHGPPRKGRPLPMIFLGDGRGRFRVWTEAHFPPLPYDYGDVEAADFDGDGVLDVALSAHLRGIVALVHEAGGHYAPWGDGLGLTVPGEAAPSEPAANGASPDEPELPAIGSRAIDVVDWNRDGRPDIVAVNEGPARFATTRDAEAFVVYLNRDRYWERVVPERRLRGFGGALAIGDVDGNGRPDAMLGTQVAGARLLLQMNAPFGWVPRELRSLPARATVTAVTLHDFDGDRRDDVVYGALAVEDDRYCATLQVVQMRPDAEAPIGLWSDVSREPVAAIAVGDLDRDGHDDIVAVRERGKILTFTGAADGFTRDLEIETPDPMRGCSTSHVELADLDGDGSLELLASYAGEGGGLGVMSCPSRGGFAAWRLRGE